MSEAGLVVIQVSETVNPVLIGRDGHRYISPPQPRKQAIELVALLLGQPLDENDRACQQWSRPTAGGRLTVTLTLAGRPAEPTPATTTKDGVGNS